MKSILPLVFVFFACGGNPDAPEPGAVASDSLSTELGSGSLGKVAGLVPREDGLQLLSPAGGEAVFLPFGSPQAELIQRVSALLGSEPTMSSNEECGAGPVSFATWPTGFELAMQEGLFAGWWLEKGEAGTQAHSTAADISIGSTRTELESKPGFELVESTLGTEFMLGEMAGLLSGPEPEARVTDLWAGVSCTFR